jgi:endonuclease YncB( thermonuclease family)
MRNLIKQFFAVGVAVTFLYAGQLNADSPDIDTYSNTYDAKLISVTEAATIEVWAQIDRATYARVVVRVRGVETPGYNGRARCTNEWRWGTKARDFTKKFIGKTRDIVLTKVQYSERRGIALADVHIRGDNLAEALLAHGYAIPYTSGPRTHHWCKPTPPSQEKRLAAHTIPR